MECGLMRGKIYAEDKYNRKGFNVKESKISNNVIRISSKK